MKAMKYVGLGLIAASAFCFTTPAGATTPTTPVTVDVESEDTLTLDSVPENYDFTTTIKADGAYSLETPETDGDSLGNIAVVKGYTGEIESNKVWVTLSSLTIQRGSDELTDSVAEVSFTFGGTTSDLNGTSDSGAISFSDSNFHSENATSGHLAKPVEKVGLNFESTALQVGDTVTGTMTYTVGATATAR